MILQLRRRDVARLANLDVDLDTRHRGGSKAEAGAKWLITHFADAVQGNVRAEIRQDDNAGQLWHACLSYGSRGQKILLDLNSYGKRGQWPDPNGGDKYSFPAHTYAALVGSVPQPGRQIDGRFCAEGDLFPPGR
ncbi:hypothetical protein [Spirillospora albida]|uniref:hypothetical protein n=1 Tax=Spirillospora albida TaxID=58123 RepID=UPI0004C02351|nr:hypothetical protein [Spirillospora albida]